MSACICWVWSSDQRAPGLVLMELGGGGVGTLGSGWGLRAPALSLRVARVVGVDEEFGSFIKKMALQEVVWVN